VSPNEQQTNSSRVINASTADSAVLAFSRASILIVSQALRVFDFVMSVRMEQADLHGQVVQH